MGKIVIAGGPHATFWPDEALACCDAVVIGEAESVWAQVLQDAERGELQPKYFGQPSSLEGLPTPRYDLLSPGFFVRRVIQATRGCPFFCSFCSVPSVNPGFRVRPAAQVLRDIAYDDFPHWWQRKVVWLWDDNLTRKTRLHQGTAPGDDPLEEVVADASQHGHRPRSRTAGADA